ncbi:MAG: FAD-dependent oxidoreductase [Candidatus Ventricola sp.]
MKRFLILVCTFVLAMSLMCMPALAEALTDGVYEGTGAGFAGELKVAVTVEGGRIAQVEVLSHSDTAGVCDPALAQIPAAIVEKQSADVDAASGATFTSNGIMAAVKNALNPEEEEEKAEQVCTISDPDVLVVGAGIAGMRTAIEACRNGAKVVVLEKTGVVGGTIGGGTLIGINSKLQAEAGIEDDPELLVEDVRRLNEGYRARTPGVEYTWNEDLTRYFAEHCGEEVDWVVDLGVEFASEKNRTPSQPTLYEPLSVNRISSCVRSSLTDVVYGELEKFIEAGQCCILFEEPATELIMDGDAVVGARTEKADYYAKATVLCTGGYGRSEELVTRYNFKNFTTTSYWFTTGDGMLMAEKAGAVLSNMDFLTAYAGGLKTPEGGLTRTMSIRVKDFPYLVFVNKDGKRFVDEMGKEDGSSYDEITSWWTKGDNIVYIMVDQGMVDDLKAQEKPIITGDSDWSKFEDQLAKGNILYSGSTIAEVAEKAGINAENLEATIEKYNTYAENGYDEEFGRTRLMKAFTGGTYYIFETTPYIMITEGGPLMNTKAQVLNQEGNPIPGLYEAGEIVGTANAFGRTTIGGTGNTGNLVWGKLAGEHAAKYALGLE